MSKDILDILNDKESVKSSGSRVSRDGNWAQDSLEKVALAGLREQRRARRWSIFFKLLFLLYVVIISFAIFSKSGQESKKDLFGNTVINANSEHIALVRLSGAIGAGEKANAEILSQTLLGAAENKNVKGILILANSPGGSPVQSSFVYKTIKQIKIKYPNKKIITSVADVCASGCYYIVAASDEIYADESSIVGSIGVISQGVGYGGLMEKVGLDSRTLTAGSNKAFMDPTKPIKESDKVFLQGLLDELHQNFITAVKDGRKDKLKNDPDLFTGLFWTGTKSKELGLIDGIATPAEVATKFGNYPVYDYSFVDPLEKVLERFGAKAVDVVTESANSVMNPKQSINFR